jgi:hypothetical protein
MRLIGRFRVGIAGPRGDTLLFLCCLEIKTMAQSSSKAMPFIKIINGCMNSMGYF